MLLEVQDVPEAFQTWDRYRLPPQGAHSTLAELHLGSLYDKKIHEEHWIGLVTIDEFANVGVVHLTVVGPTP